MCCTEEWLRLGPLFQCNGPVGRYGRKLHKTNTAILFLFFSLKCMTIKCFYLFIYLFIIIIIFFFNRIEFGTRGHIGIREPIRP